MIIMLVNLYCWIETPLRYIGLVGFFMIGWYVSAYYGLKKQYE